MSSADGMSKVQQAAALEAEACGHAATGHTFIAHGYRLLAETERPGSLSSDRAKAYEAMAKGHEEIAQAQEIHLAVGKLRTEAMRDIGPAMQKGLEYSSTLPDAPPSPDRRD